MVKVLAVNNYPSRERFERLERCIEGNGAQVTSIDWNDPTIKKLGSYDGVVLSGSPDMMSSPRTQTKFHAEIDAIRDSSVPVLGVCFGHQILAHSFGSWVVKDSQHVLRFVKTEVLAKNSLFLGMPKSLMLLESREEIVSSLPEGFELIAKSETSPIATMKHRSRPLYGIQSHPERYSKENPEGNQIVANFLRLLK